MIMLGGTIYQALGDGRVAADDDKAAVPYAAVTYLADEFV